MNYLFLILGLLFTLQIFCSERGMQGLKDDSYQKQMVSLNKIQKADVLNNDVLSAFDNLNAMKNFNKTDKIKISNIDFTSVNSLEKKLIVDMYHKGLIDENCTDSDNKILHNMPFFIMKADLSKATTVNKKDDCEENFILNNTSKTIYQQPYSDVKNNNISVFNIDHEIKEDKKNKNITQGLNDIKNATELTDEIIEIFNDLSSDDNAKESLEDVIKSRNRNRIQNNRGKIKKSAIKFIDLGVYHQKLICKMFFWGLIDFNCTDPENNVLKNMNFLKPDGTPEVKNTVDTPNNNTNQNNRVVGDNKNEKIKNDDMNINQNNNNHSNQNVTSKKIMYIDQLQHCILLNQPLLDSFDVWSKNPNLHGTIKEKITAREGKKIITSNINFFMLRDENEQQLICQMYSLGLIDKEKCCYINDNTNERKYLKNAGFFTKYEASLNKDTNSNQLKNNDIKIDLINNTPPSIEIKISNNDNKTLSSKNQAPFSDFDQSVNKTIEIAPQEKKELSVPEKKRLMKVFFTDITNNLSEDTLCTFLCVNSDNCYELKKDFEIAKTTLQYYIKTHRQMAGDDNSPINNYDLKNTEKEVLLKLIRSGFIQPNFGGILKISLENRDQGDYWQQYLKAFIHHFIENLAEEETKKLIENFFSRSDEKLKGDFLRIYFEEYDKYNSAKKKKWQIQNYAAVWADVLKNVDLNNYDEIENILFDVTIDDFSVWILVDENNKRLKNYIDENKDKPVIKKEITITRKKNQTNEKEELKEINDTSNIIPNGDPFYNKEPDNNSNTVVLANNQTSEQYKITLPWSEFFGTVDITNKPDNVGNLLKQNGLDAYGYENLVDSEEIILKNYLEKLVGNKTVKIADKNNSNLHISNTNSNAVTNNKTAKNSSTPSINKNTVNKNTVGIKEKERIIENIDNVNNNTVVNEEKNEKPIGGTCVQIIPYIFNANNFELEKRQHNVDEEKYVDKEKYENFELCVHGAVEACAKENRIVKAKAPWPNLIAEKNGKENLKILLHYSFINKDTTLDSNNKSLSEYGEINDPKNREEKRSDGIILIKNNVINSDEVKTNNEKQSTIIIKKESNENNETPKKLTFNKLQDYTQIDDLLIEEFENLRQKEGVKKVKEKIKTRQRKITLSQINFFTLIDEKKQKLICQMYSDGLVDENCKYYQDPNNIRLKEEEKFLKNTSFFKKYTEELNRNNQQNNGIYQENNLEVNKTDVKKEKLIKNKIIKIEDDSGDQNNKNNNKSNLNLENSKNSGNNSQGNNQHQNNNNQINPLNNNVIPVDNNQSVNPVNHQNPEDNNQNNLVNNQNHNPGNNVLPQNQVNLNNNPINHLNNIIPIDNNQPVNPLINNNQVVEKTFLDQLMDRAKNKKREVAITTSLVILAFISYLLIKKPAFLFKNVHQGT